MEEISLHSLTNRFLEDQSQLDGCLVTLKGWARTNRNNGKLGFIAFNDGSVFPTLQLVYEKEQLDMHEYECCSKVGNGDALIVEGKIVLTPQAKQPYEMHITHLEITAKCSSDYPLQKKRHSFEYLREIPHIRPRANTFMAVFKVRSLLSMAFHEFFQSNDFVYVHTPIVTTNDGEGAGETFVLTTREDGNYEKDFFGKKALINVTGQLHVEQFALAFNKVYTFGPVLRAEPSNTTTHAAEFWMIEPEFMFATLEDNMNLIESCIKYCIRYVMEHGKEEIDFFNQFVDRGLKERLTHILDSSFRRMTYTEAIEILEAHKDQFEMEPYWGIDMAKEHERFLCEKIVAGPVFITDYPKEIKAFYMLQNEDGKTVSACDLLVPGIGELVGGSAREYRYEKLKARMEELNMLESHSLDWYLETRQYGNPPHAGFGIGFERFLMYITGMENIRDVLPFPRTFKNLKL